MTVDLSGLPARVTVRVGEQALVELPSYAGSGNAWSALPLSGEEVAGVTVGPAPTAAAPSPAAEESAPPPTMAVPQRAVVDGRAPGVARWRLSLARRFGEDPPLAEHELEVRVLGNPRPGKG